MKKYMLALIYMCAAVMMGQPVFAQNQVTNDDQPQAMGQATDNQTEPGAGMMDEGQGDNQVMMPTEDEAAAQAKSAEESQPADNAAAAEQAPQADLQQVNADQPQAVNSDQPQTNGDLQQANADQPQANADQPMNNAEQANAEQVNAVQPEAATVPTPAALAATDTAAAQPAAGSAKQAVSFGDYRSSTLTTKAWQALAKNDIESVLAYTNKCIELYGEQARKMQAELKDFPTGGNDAIFKYWALNDVATSYYIQGEVYRKANMKDEAKEAYSKLIKDYSFGQSWDVKGWFWKPADAAKEKLAMAEAGVNLDFGDYSSSQLVQKAWAALAANDLNGVVAYANKNLELYSSKAKDMQSSLKEYPWESKEKTMSYWALNDVGTTLFILGEAYRNAGKKDDAAKTYKKLIDEYFYAQCWDPQGWFWKPAEAAQQKLAELDNV